MSPEVKLELNEAEKVIAKALIQYLQQKRRDDIKKHSLENNYGYIDAINYLKELIK